jgi:hypothetical protein
MPTPISNRVSADYYELPPLVVHTVEFIKHFFLFFLLPIVAVVISAVVAATVFRLVQRALFARLASPEKLLEDALVRLRRSDRYSYGPSAAHRREEAWDTLRHVIRMRPEAVKAYIVLGTELLYSHMNDRAGKRDERISIRGDKSTHNPPRRRRGAQTTEEASRLAECERIIERGLILDPTNDSLLKLQGELRLVNEYGLHGAQTRMIKVGRLDWME